MADESSRMAEQLALTFEDPESNPYFLWSEDMTLRELREILAGSQGESTRLQYMARILRECRLRDVWEFLKPQDILNDWNQLERRLGRSKSMWTYLIDVWQRHGLL